MIDTGIDPSVVAVAGIAVLVGAVIQGAVGLGVGLVAAPVVSLLDPSLMPGSLLVVGFALPVLSLVSEHRHIDPRVGWVFLGRVLGTAPGVAVVALLTREQLAIGVALLTLVAVAFTVRTVHVAATRTTLAGAGMLSAVGATAAAIGGPPLALVYQRAEAATLRATLALVFAVGSLLSLGALAVAGQLSAREVWTGVAMLPFFLVGFLLSLGLRGRLSGPRFRVAVLVVVTGSALALLVRSLLG
ncbi:MAG: sulfite exporter TauE/SafE family protein [Actinomycetota bacterium]|nr:sulfite exporter TauE/SafE family protein [Actinomycetota bacterium]